MDSLQKSSYASMLKGNRKANELLGYENFENFKETSWRMQKLLELPEFTQLFMKCAPKSMEYISENLVKIVKGKEIEFFENFTDVTYAHDTCADEMISFLKQAVEKLQENTAADC